jgi:hypothetical protein
MINVNLIQKEPFEAIADITIMYRSQVKTLLELGFIFNYEYLSFTGELAIGKEIYEVNIYKTSEYIHLIITDNKSIKIGSHVVNRQEKEEIKEMSIQPLLSYLLLFKKDVEEKAKKSFSEYVKSEKE